MLGRIQKHASARLNLQGETNMVRRLAIYRRFLKLETEMMRRRHRSGESGLNIVALRSAFIDALLEHLFACSLTEYEREHGAAPAPVCMIALGGYGRGELSPLSDIDIMFLFPSGAGGANFKTFQQYLSDHVLYPLWDLSLKIGHSTRTIDEAFDEARNNILTKTALLESRLIAGSENLFAIFTKANENFSRKENPKAYLEARLSDQAERRRRHGETPFLQEPDIKNGVGGLRDYQNCLWMARIKLGITRVQELVGHNYLRKNEQEDFTEAYDFLLRVRNDLHFMVTRPTDLLDLEKQQVVAQHLGYAEKDPLERVEHFMRDYYRHAHIIHRYSKILEKRLALRSASPGRETISFREVIAARKLDRQKRMDGFLLRGNELTFENPGVFKTDPARLIRVFRHCQQLRCVMDFDLESLVQESLSLITQKVVRTPGANLSFRAILEEAGAVFPALHHMHELGVLGRFVPEFGRLTCLVQHELYHRYTADIHTLNTIRELDDIYALKEPSMERYRRVLHSLNRPVLLYLILLLHDIGKSAGIAGHAEAGVKIARRMLKRLQIPRREWDLILFIIEHHLMMARIWQKHDVDDPQTIESFAKEIGDTERLSFLYIHTFCDARGTSAGLWNSYKDMLHESLYRSTFEHLTRRDSLTNRNKLKRKMTLREMKGKNLPEVSAEEVQAHHDLMPERYFAQTEASEVILHIRMVHELFSKIAATDSNGSLVPVVEWKDDLDRGFTVVHVVTWDRAGLFSRMAGSFALAGLNILTAKAFSRADHLAVDTFYVVEPNRGAVRSENARGIFENSLREALVENKDLLPAITAAAGRHASASRWTMDTDNLRTPVPPQARVSHDPEIGRVFVEIQATDRLGLLYLLTRTIFDHGFSIAFARIATERGIAIDSFYIEDAHPGESQPAAPGQEQLAALENALREVVNPATETLNGGN